jgi:hypothetical protein
VENHSIQEGRATIAYVGSNWDSERHRGFFRTFDATGLVGIYGRPDGWQFLTKSYRGALAFDGHAVIDALASAGIGLCLHMKSHTNAGLPTMRIFETAMAGAIAIADRHPFITREFGDSVLYVDTDDEAQFIAGVRRHIEWVNANPDLAIDKARRAHQIAQRFSLERLIGDAVTAHRKRLHGPGG